MKQNEFIFKIKQCELIALSEDGYLTNGDLAIKKEYATTDSDLLNSLIAENISFKYSCKSKILAKDIDLKCAPTLKIGELYTTDTGLLINYTGKEYVKIFKIENKYACINKKYTDSLDNIGTISYKAVEDESTTMLTMFLNGEAIGVIMPIIGKYINDILYDWLY